jgi:hypothetical protein
MDATKKCSKCKEEKPVSEFYKDKNTKDGLRLQCMTCTKNFNSNRKRWADQIYKDLDLTGNDY